MVKVRSLGKASLRCSRCNGKTRGNRAGAVKSVPARGRAGTMAMKQKGERERRVM